ncbi:hypothetical protein GYB59_20955 [bacterium]|nr:hypothetical protein [bacterium]
MHALQHSHKFDGTLRLLLQGCLVACLIGLSGCGSDWQASTYPARGIVSINGLPPAGAIIQLHPTGDSVDVRKSVPWALVEEDGTYTLTTYEPGDGAPAGEYAVTIKWSPDVTTPSFEDRLNNAYTNPAESQWIFTITKGKNSLPPIEITKEEVAAREKPRMTQKLPPGPEMGH